MGEIQATMAANVWKVEVEENDMVKAGDIVVILESMKMEIPIEAEQDGVVTAVETVEGDFVQEGQVLLTIREES
ncbi:biotin/lipoyl-binding carrier protein [Virgibacillus sp. MSP4-1]|uniref:biotin/lipoyl-binding carrier protein n=1 Tax=Virgibacillus sp. MSP4-1 TaxID=2700081 RepID=UPI0005C4AE1F|nr:biotin/lipoyl-binding carrier protein [Virgibacillus sp. MSP4-1]QHS21971.1 biotin/lipoyl-binding carrier protein [Virgibacillus sp. MSP4-1]